MAGGYGGAKRMLWFIAQYANGVSEQKDLGIRFQAIAPQQMVRGTGVGDEGANAYARAMSWRRRRTPSPRATALRTDSAGRAVLLASS
jgi:hypothetical protein